MKAFRSQRIVKADRIEPGVLIVDNGKIRDIQGTLPKSFDGEIIDATNELLMPGIVDTHVHINEPGRTDWEGFETATKAAAFGGITTLVDMPLNCTPVTTSARALLLKKEAVAGKLWVDCGFWGGVTPESLPDLEELLQAGVCGVKSFLIDSGIDDFPPVSERELITAMAILKSYHLPYLIHAELADKNDPEVTITSQYQSFLNSRPKEWENRAIRLLIDLARRTQAEVHIVHLASAEALPMIRQAKEEGVPLSVETCPHYLLFAAEEISDGQTFFKCCPPIREQTNREALWQGLKDGIIDMIVSDHSPCTPQLKHYESGSFEKAWGGISSLQFTLPLIWTEAKARGFTINDLARLMCHNPAKLAGLEKQKGILAPGYDADFIFWNPETSFTIEKRLIQHRHQETPYLGRTVVGQIEEVYLRGEKIFARGSMEHGPKGQFLSRGCD